MKYEDLILSLKDAYNNAVEERDRKEVDHWKLKLQREFHQMLSTEGKEKLLEIGAGTGHASLFFEELGLDVTCTDLSPENVMRCLSKGLDAYEMDFMNLNFPVSSFEAVFAMNCLLHVPQQKFQTILQNVHQLLKASGLFFLGQYGGKEFAGINPDDHYSPKRYFSLMTDTQIMKLAEEVFLIKRFETIKHADEDEFHFQYLFLRKE